MTMTIDEIKGYATGVSGIEIEGEVIRVETPEHRQSKPDAAKEYDFWSQKIFIDDGTGSFECSIGVNSEDDGIEKGVIARVKGKLKEWQGNRKLQGSLIGISKGDKVIDVQQEKAEKYFDKKAKEEKKTLTTAVPAIVPTTKPIEDKNAIWEAKDLRIARECAVKAVTELVAAKIMDSKKFFVFADTIVKYIYNGNGSEKKAKEGILRDNREPLVVIDKKAPFPDETISDEDLPQEDKPGSSPANAHKFTGKKKALKLVSKGEDFIAPEDLPE